LSFTDDVAVGWDVEQELDGSETLSARAQDAKPARKKRPWTKRIPIWRRTEAINLKILGKEDPEFHVIETGKKGSYIVRKRAHPLQPIQEQAFIPSNEIPRPVVATPQRVTAPATPEAQGAVILPLKQDNQEIPIISYFSNQNIVNSSLSKELNEVREMCNKLINKYEEKQTVKKENAPLGLSHGVAKKIKRASLAEGGETNDEAERKKSKRKETEEPDVTDEEVEAYMEFIRQQERRQAPPPPVQQPQQLRPRRRILDISKY
jgi:hypothetical protein